MLCYSLHPCHEPTQVGNPVKNGGGVQSSFGHLVAEHYTVVQVLGRAVTYLLRRGSDLREMLVNWGL